MNLNSANKFIFIHFPNRKVYREYKQLFPFSFLESSYKIIPIFGESFCAQEKNFISIHFANITQKLHTFLHFCMLWQRKFSSLSYQLRAYQYFGSKKQVLATSNWLPYNGARYKFIYRISVYFFGNFFGIYLLKNLLNIFFTFENYKNTNIYTSKNSLLILPYGGGISLEYDFLVWQSKKQKVKSVAIQENWDNLSSKSFLFQHPTYFLTWGKQSSSHLRSLHSYTGIIREIGSLRIADFYRAKTKIEHVKRRSRRVNDLRGKFIILVIGTGAANHDLNTIEIIRKSLLVSNKGQAIIIYRPHPFSRISESDFNQIKSIKDLKIDFSDATEKNIHRLNLVLKSSVVVSLFSTMVLEASIINKTCIIPSFVTSKLIKHTSNFLDDSPHFSGLSNLSTIRVATTTENFIELLQEPCLTNNENFNSRVFLNWYCKDTNTSREILKFIDGVMN